MIKKLLSLMIGFTLIVSSSIAGPLPNMKEGKWEITSKTEMIGMPMEMPAVTVTQCLTQEEMVPDNAQQGQECKTSRIRTSGDTVKWTMTCQSPGGTLKGNGHITYKGDRFNGSMEITQQGMKMVNRMKGRYVGKCD